MTDKNKETPGAATPGETILGTAAGDSEAARQSEESTLQQVHAATIDGEMQKAPVVAATDAQEAAIKTLGNRVSVLESRTHNLESVLIGKLTSSDVLNARL